MMKNVLYLFLFSVFLITSFTNQTKAEDTDPSKELIEVITQEAEPTIDLDLLPNLANTDYSPDSLSNGNESSDRLSAGKYRTKLGGTFRTVKNGTYSAIANGYSYFEVK
ncbi:hypothetical protein [Peribacillus simplex]|uniref:hypothetical protein n=1 Tax=Peribacillus simplex TaxID=1478 RepID=UPI0024C07E7F|nr:hypothetical protein [Peribacillus simplex]WHY96537.1 hypothetical protein QNH37_21565 [Peribacillus simplex]